MSAQTGGTEIYHFPDFFDRLQAKHRLEVRDAVTAETEIDGITYHHRGVQVPASTAAFVWDESAKAFPTFRLVVQALGPRTVWAEFDARMDWDVYLLLYEKGATVAWMSTSEFEEDEAGDFPSKHAAIKAGRFSFGTVFLVGPDWIEREDWALESTAPAAIQRGDGTMFAPYTAEEFYQASAAIPPEFHQDKTSPPPSYLGVTDASLTATHVD